MKKLSILAFCLFFGMQVQAQNPKHYLGDYRVVNGPIDKIIITWENDKLFGTAVGQGKAELKASKTADIYEVMGYDGEVQFTRNENKKVTSLTLRIKDQKVSAERQTPPLKDYLGKFKMVDGPVSAMIMTEEYGKLMAEIPEMGKSEIKESSIIDEFSEDNYNSKILFTRNDKNEVDGIQIEAQGMTLKGAKEAKANPYIGHYEFESAPISNVEIIENENGNLYGKASEGESLLAKTANPDVFEIIDYDGEAIFERNSDGSVKALTVKIEGEVMKGKKRK